MSGDGLGGQIHSVVHIILIRFQVKIDIKIMAQPGVNSIELDCMLKWDP